jgi:hypothetical protein
LQIQRDARLARLDLAEQIGMDSRHVGGRKIDFLGQLDVIELA